MAQRHMDRLRSFDTSFLTNERGGAHMAIGAVLMFAGEAPAEADLFTHVGARLHQVPRLRQRLCARRSTSARRTGSTTDFQLRNHFADTLPAPGTEEQFRELAGGCWSRRSTVRPLWELNVVEGFADERFAIVYRTHHAMADGISAVDIGMLLFDVEPRGRAGSPPGAWRPPAPGGGPPRRRAARPLRHRRPADPLGPPRGRAPERAWRSAVDGLIGVWEVTLNLLARRRGADEPRGSAGGGASTG